jgi:hypothetical protein
MAALTSAPDASLKSCQYLARELLELHALRFDRIGAKPAFLVFFVVGESALR